MTIKLFIIILIRTAALEFRPQTHILLQLGPTCTAPDIEYAKYFLTRGDLDFL